MRFKVTTGLGWVKRVNASSSASVPPTKATMPLEHPTKIMATNPNRSHLKDRLDCGRKEACSFMVFKGLRQTRSSASCFWQIPTTRC